MGTRISDLPVTKVVDGDTIKVQIDAAQESLRLACVDTEESQPGGSKPVTRAGKAASEMAKAYFTTSGGGLARVDIEFDTDDPVETCLVKHRDNYGRLLCYVHKGDENYNLKLVREGWSPYFVKYGRSRVHHEPLIRAEADAEARELPIWDPAFNAGGPARDYEVLLPWWGLRDSIVQDFRLVDRPDVLSVRLDYAKLEAAAQHGERVTVLCDIQEGIKRRPGDGALIYAGSPSHPFNLWIPDARSEDRLPLVRLIESRYAGEGGRNYVYASGKAEAFRGTPQIVLTELDQLSDLPP
jgi:micrococcal nuclease